MLEYRIDYTNPSSSSGPVSQVVITDPVSGFTPLVTGAYSGGTADIEIIVSVRAVVVPS
ncbi:MAG: hypothetical protein U5L04_04505 [Trueperaceae bacterium]|nr:hypothetical protein [Trueperaceae bacterium]